MFEKTLPDIVKGIRSHKKDPDAYLQRVLGEIREEVKSADQKIKAQAVEKLVYLQMFGRSMNWASFNVVECISSSHFKHKRIGYLAAAQSFSPDTDVILLLTNLLKKQLSSHNPFEAGAALNCLSNIVTKDLARDLLEDVSQLLGSTRPFVRKKAILTLFKMFVRYPQGLRLCFERLREKLEDPDPGVQGAAVNVICELARTNPRNYLGLAPQLFKIMLDCSNNWMLIKLVKLLGVLVGEEPRLARKLLEPLAAVIQNTPAKSLMYECVHTVTLALPYTARSDGSQPKIVPSVVRLCVTKLREMVEDPDQNLKYLGLVGMWQLMKSHPRVVVEDRSLVMACLDDADVTIRLRALELIVGMVTRRNLVEVVRTLLEHVEVADGHYRDELIRKIIFICSRDKYRFLAPHFLWYFSVLVDLAFVRGRHGHLVASQMLDVAMRVEGARQHAVRSVIPLLADHRLSETCMAGGMTSVAAHSGTGVAQVTPTVDSAAEEKMRAAAAGELAATAGSGGDAAAASGGQSLLAMDSARAAGGAHGEGKGRSAAGDDRAESMAPVLFAAAWITGEYAKLMRPVEVQNVLGALLAERTTLLPGTVQAVFVQAATKVLAAAASMGGTEADATVPSLVVGASTSGDSAGGGDDLILDFRDADAEAEHEGEDATAAKEAGEAADAAAQAAARTAAASGALANFPKLCVMVHGALAPLCRAVHVETQERAVALRRLLEEVEPSLRPAPTAEGGSGSGGGGGGGAGEAGDSSLLNFGADTGPAEGEGGAEAGEAAAPEAQGGDATAEGDVAKAEPEVAAPDPLLLVRLFAEPLRPVHPRAQRRVPVPEGLDLDAPISEEATEELPGAEPEFPVVSFSEFKGAGIFGGGGDEDFSGRALDDSDGHSESSGSEGADGEGEKHLSKREELRRQRRRERQRRKEERRREREAKERSRKNDPFYLAASPGRPSPSPAGGSGGGGGGGGGGAARSVGAVVDDDDEEDIPLVDLTGEDLGPNAVTLRVERDAGATSSSRGRLGASANHLLQSTKEDRHRHREQRKRRKQRDERRRRGERVSSSEDEGRLAVADEDDLPEGVKESSSEDELAGAGRRPGRRGRGGSADSDELGLGDVDLSAPLRSDEVMPSVGAYARASSGQASDAQMSRRGRGRARVDEEFSGGEEGDAASGRKHRDKKHKRRHKEKGEEEGEGAEDKGKRKKKERKEKEGRLSKRERRHADGSDLLDLGALGSGEPGKAPKGDRKDKKDKERKDKKEKRDKDKKEKRDKDVKPKKEKKEKKHRRKERE